MRPTCKVIATILAFAVLAACDSKAETPSEEVNGKPNSSLAPLDQGEPALDPAIVAAADPKATDPPLEHYWLSDEQARIVSRGRMIVGDKCMRELGFEPAAGAQPDGRFPLVTWSRYGLSDPIGSKTHGYDEAGVMEAASAPNAASNRYSGEAGMVYLGMVTESGGKPVPTGGCQGEELRLILNDAQSTVDGNFVQDLSNEALIRSQQDSRVKPLLAAWSACMKKAGWNYSSPMEPFEYWATRRGESKRHVLISADELRSAADDIGCKKSTKLLATWLAADIAYQNAIIERESTKLNEYKQVLNRMVERANKAIAGG